MSDEDTFSPEILSKGMLGVTTAALHQVMHRATYHRHVVKPYRLQRFERKQFDLSHLDTPKQAP